jgi:putative hemolysin
MYELGIIGVMLVLNALFAGYEMALAAIPKSKLSLLVSQKRKGAGEAVFMKDRMEASLAVIQLGITLVGVVAAATGGAGVSESFVPYLKDVIGLSDTIAEIVALICLAVPLSCFMIIFAELVPKVFSLNNKEWVCLTFSPAFKALFHFVCPVVRIFEFIVKAILRLGRKRGMAEVRSQEFGELHELMAAASLARASKLIGAQEEKIVLSAAQLSGRPVKDIMMAASDISMIPAASTLTEALVKAHLDMHTRFPVCSRENDPQTIVGYVTFKDIVNALKMSPGDPSLKGITRAIKSFSSGESISGVLERMMREKTHIALVVCSQTQKIMGMVTLEDIIEELVGEIEDEFDRLPAYIHPYGKQWLMGGAVAMSTVASTVGAQIPWGDRGEGSFAESSISLAQWCSQKLGKPLGGGEVIEADGISVTVRKLRRRKMAEAIVAKLPPA